MIALDTNILARFVLSDDAEQAAAARTILGGLSQDNPGYVCREVVLELVWVLDRVHRLGRAEVARTVTILLESRELVFETAERVATALSHYAAGGPGFADRMILLAARDAGAGLVTFDAGLARVAGEEAG